MKKGNRVVITSFGLASPDALSGQTFWNLIEQGKSAIRWLPKYEETGCAIGGEVPDFDQSFLSSIPKNKRLARHTLLLLYAAKQIRQDVALLQTRPITRLGLATSCFNMIGESGALRVRKGVDATNCHMITQAPPHAAAGALGQYLGFANDSVTVSTACAAGLDAVGLAAREISRGYAQSAIAGGGDSALGVSPLAEFVKAGMASLRNQSPGQASRPFDVFADSGVLSEGAGLFVLEELSAAQKRKAKIYMEIISHASFLDPDRDSPGSGYATCMQMALEEAELNPEEIDYISAWGPGHPVIDRAEAAAIEKIFGSRNPSIPITSIKGVIGNPLAAAGPLQMIAAIYTAHTGLLSPIANLEIPWSDLRLDFVQGKSRKFKPRTCLINAHGVGGANSCLILKTWIKTPRHDNQVALHQDSLYA